ncbi:hypothetical protein SACS_1666 [Parasaccharibacter apium]|uniref:Uncharacterized protein n=1 Tax=Parasaccharibacter apium TaxID=1510841 RepID=A0A7U7G739_9PROT|nr:hypothetical protein SACS_1666 [Parasaccharibacter apium]
MVMFHVELEGAWGRSGRKICPSGWKIQKRMFCLKGGYG